MPNLYVLSDLHREFAPFSPDVPPGVDVVILAGDIDNGTKGLDWARAVFPKLPVVYVAGNHEYYGEAIPKLTQNLRERAQQLDVAFLENDAVEIEGVHFLGCTLWTDLELLGTEPWRADAIRRTMVDYRSIRVSPAYRRLRPTDTAALHARSRRWLRNAMHGARPTVVVTHHAPSLKSIAPQHADDPVTAAYASHLDDLIQDGAPEVWIHGHTHHSVDYRIGSTRVLSNQRGYEDEPGVGFDESLVVTVAGRANSS